MTILISCKRGAERPPVLKRRVMAPKPIQDNSFLPAYIPKDDMMKNLTHYEMNPLFLYLSEIWGEAKTIQLMARYNVGTSKKWGGSAVF